MIGEVVGNYRISGVLGEGGMGVVYRAEHVQLGRPAALKMLQPSLSADPTIVQRFFNEARAASSIDHPGIVEVYDFGTHEGRAYLVMALLRGESLEDRLAPDPLRGRLGTIEGATIVAQVAAALAAAHARGIVHRDLKPDNIFLVPNELMPGGIQVKLLDFGIAKLADERVSGVRTQTGALIGTPAYMSPEQCMGSADIDHRTDLYSLGCILFHVLCGRPPFTSDAGTGLMIAMHLRDPAPPPRSLNPNISEALAAVVTKLLEKEPGARYQTANELRDALVRAGANAPLTKPPRNEGSAAAIEYASTVAVPVSVSSRRTPAALGDTVVSTPPSDVIERPRGGPTTGAGYGQVVATPPPVEKRRNWIAVAAIVTIGLGATAIALALILRDKDDKRRDPAGAPKPTLAKSTEPAEHSDPADPTGQLCTAGMLRGPDTAGHCCWPNQVWSQSRRACFGEPSCPKGSVRSGDDCVTPGDHPPIAVKVVEPNAEDAPTTKAPNLALVRSQVAPNGIVSVELDAPIYSLARARAWVAIAKVGAPAGTYLDWVYVEHRALSASLRAPAEPGSYEVRLLTNYPTDPHNVVHAVPFTVVGPVDTAGETPRALQRFEADARGRVGVPVEVHFPVALQARPDERFWVTVVARSAGDEAWATWTYVPANVKTIRLTAPTKPGEFEIRLHANYPTRAYNVVYRQPITIE